MTEACFHREFFVLGLLAWGLGLYILSYAVIQTLIIHTGSLGICGVSG
jgi:hypothetical protein